MKKLTKHLSIASLAVATLFGLGTECRAYEIWAGTQNFVQEMVTNPGGWDLTAQKMAGLNCNWATVDLNADDRDEVIDMFATAGNHAYQVQNHPHGPITTNNEWSTAFDRADMWHYHLDYLYIYSSGGDQVYTEPEVQIMRNWLDNNGHADCKIAYNGRNIGNTEELGWPLIKGAGIENDPARWLEEGDTRAELLQWIANPTNAATAGEMCVLHTKLRGLNDETNAVTVYNDCRKWVRYINRDVLTNRASFVQSNKFVFTIFGKTGVPSMPETTNGDTQYVKTAFGLWLSLAEQKSKFSGLLGAWPTDAECESVNRITNAPGADLNILQSAPAFDVESNPGDDSIIRIAGGGTKVAAIKGNSWIRFDTFDFGESTLSKLIVTASSKLGGGLVEFRLNATNGPSLGSVDVTDTGLWTTMKNFTNANPANATGPHDLYLRFVDDHGTGAELMNVQSFQINTQ